MQQSLIAFCSFLNPTRRTMHIRALTLDDLAQVCALAEASVREGFRFVQRFADDMPSTALDSPAQWFLGVFDGDTLRAIGGVTSDPYAPDANVGRIRRVLRSTRLHASARCRGHACARASGPRRRRLTNVATVVHS
jgi:hypothetical protein